MRTRSLAIGLLLVFVLSAQAFGQSTFATVSGTVADLSGAVLPGVSLTGTNNATGIATNVISNEAGAYNLTSLLPVCIQYRRNCRAFKKQLIPMSRLETLNRSA
jgi:hypothetical protein